MYYWCCIGGSEGLRPCSASCIHHCRYAAGLSHPCFGHSREITSKLGYNVTPSDLPALPPSTARSSCRSLTLPAQQQTAHTQAARSPGMLLQAAVGPPDSPAAAAALLITWRHIGLAVLTRRWSSHWGHLLQQHRQHAKHPANKKITHIWVISAVAA